MRDFIEKLAILTGENFENLNKLLAHTKKNTQSRTNQNFYLLWIAVAHIEKDKVIDDKNRIFADFLKVKGIHKILSRIREYDDWFVRSGRDWYDYGIYN